MGLESNLEGQAALIEPGRSSRGDHRRARERLPLVAEQQLSVLDPTAVLALLLERILDLEQVGEVGRRLDPHSQVDRRVVMVQDRQLFTETTADPPPSDHRQLRVDVDRSGSRDEEEARLEVIEIVDGERIQPLTVHGQHPLGEEARVEGEEARRIGQ